MIFFFLSDLWILEVRERLGTISGATVLRKAQKLLCSKAGAEDQKMPGTHKKDASEKKHASTKTK